MNSPWPQDEQPVDHRDWDEPWLQTVANYGDLAVLLVGVFAIVAAACGWLD